MKLSSTESEGSSTAKPPACATPRFTSCARSRKCAWQELISDQVLSTPMIGLPMKSSSARPSCIIRERWPKLRRSSGANQRALRSFSGLFLIGLSNIMLPP